VAGGLSDGGSRVAVGWDVKAAIKRSHLLGTRLQPCYVRAYNGQVETGGLQLKHFRGDWLETSPDRCQPDFLLLLAFQDIHIAADEPGKRLRHLRQ
jgi:hypothetical protein